MNTLFENLLPLVGLDVPEGGLGLGPHRAQTAQLQLSCNIPHSSHKRATTRYKLIL